MSKVKIDLSKYVGKKVEATTREGVILHETVRRVGKGLYRSVELMQT